MSESPTLPALNPRRLWWLRLAGRAGGMIAVVLGGWSLWLAFSTGEQPDQIEALDDWREPAAAESDDLPEWLHSKPRRESPAVKITHVSPATEADSKPTVEPAGYVSLRGAPTESIEMASFSTESNGETAASAAWLTGEIEDAAEESQQVPREAEVPPAWKRTTKSLKASLHSTRSATQR